MGPVYVAGVLVSLLAITPSAAMASATATWANGTEAPLPLNGVDFVTNVNAVSCPSAGNCGAVGIYANNASPQAEVGLLLNETAGSWPAHGTGVTLPGNADSTNQSAPLDSVSCASAGNCSAVGSYYTGSNQRGMLVSEKSGHWQPAVEAMLPTAAGSSLNLTSVSCASAGNCSAAGYYLTTGKTVGLLLNQIAGAWHKGVAVSPPANVSKTDDVVNLNSLSCASPGNCAAVGSYSGPSNTIQAIVVTEVAGRWQKGAEPLLPNNAETLNQDAELNSVSCRSAGNCSAAGFYTTSAGYRGLLLNEVAGKWQRGIQPHLPPGAATTNQGTQLFAVSCGAPGNCSAGGYYADGSGNNTEGLLMDEVAGKWQRGVKAPLPNDAVTSNQAVLLISMSCVSPGDCTAVGNYGDMSGDQQGLMLSETSGKWQTGIEAVLPSNQATNPEVSLSDVSETGGPSVSCALAGSCTTVGTYIQTTGNDNDGLLLTTSPAHPTLSLTGPASGKVGHLIAASSVAARLASGSAPVGTIAFKVFGPQPSAPSSCVSGGRTVGSANVSANATYHPSAGFTPAKAGDYWWFAAYGGDASDLPAASKCGASMAKTVVR